MSEIASDWSLSALLLFGGVFTTLTVGAAIFLAESWFQKMRQRERISRFGKTGGSKSGKRSNANPFSGSIGPAKKAQSKVTKCQTIIMRAIGRK
jgi:hypothetical protein